MFLPSPSIKTYLSVPSSVLTFVILRSLREMFYIVLNPFGKL
nr:MAG TPA: hypothetical protein [Caudoviricetes sp.]